MSYTDQLLTFITTLKVSAMVYSHGLAIRNHVTAETTDRMECEIKIV